ncbi:MAG: hypothetical protein ACRDTH_00945 [Pseudonocardiaceae bacterium]
MHRANTVFGDVAIGDASGGQFVADVLRIERTDRDELTKGEC